MRRLLAALLTIALLLQGAAAQAQLPLANAAPCPWMASMVHGGVFSPADDPADHSAAGASVASDQSDCCADPEGLGILGQACKAGQWCQVMGAMLATAMAGTTVRLPAEPHRAGPPGVHPSRPPGTVWRPPTSV